MRAIRPMPEHRHYADGLINIGGWWAVNGLQGVPVSAYAQSVSPPTRSTPSHHHNHHGSSVLVCLVDGESLPPVWLPSKKFSSILILITPSFSSPTLGH